jgi:aspartyl protease family protein
MGRGLLIYVFLFGAVMSCVANLPSGGSHRIKMSSANESRLAADSSSSSEESPSESYSGDAIKLERQWDGHFYADAEVNGRTIHFLVDTGASVIALSRDDARRAGIATSIAMPEVVGEGASGEVHGEVARLERISLGPASDSDVPAIILDDGNQSLLGQSFLSKFASVEIRGDTMVLQ